jgi:uncharacterized membrane protein
MTRRRFVLFFSLKDACLAHFVFLNLQFVADMGGSVGFLLGLSVIGLIVVLEKVLGIMFMNKFIEQYKEKQRKRLEGDEKVEKSQT